MASVRPESPEVEATLTMTPPLPCSTICSATQRPTRNGPLRVTSMTWSHSSSEMLKMVSWSVMAALLTRMSMPPKASTAARTMAFTSSVFETSHLA